MKFCIFEKGGDFGGCFKNWSEVELIEMIIGVFDFLVEEDCGFRFIGMGEVLEKEIEEEGFWWRGDRWEEGERVVDIDWGRRRGEVEEEGVVVMVGYCMEDVGVELFDVV